jgi:hypothetical protein
MKAGVGIAGLALSKWTDCRSVSMCDSRIEVVSNMKKNCERNRVTSINSFLIEFDQLDNYKV